MERIEFYADPQGGIMLKEYDRPTRELVEGDRPIIAFFLERIKTFYPDAHNALLEAYSPLARSQWHFEFRMVSRFIRCNWGNFDRIEDIDAAGNWIFEAVPCPMVGECKFYKVICQPRFESNLLPGEFRVMKLYFEGLSTEKVADRLCLSPHTARNHRKNALARLGLHSLSEFVDFAHRTNLFK